MIYLDYNASTPLRPQAKEALVATLDLTGNPSSPHHMGRQLRSLIDTARKAILEKIEGERLVFTSGGTEANALALSSVESFPVIVSAIEHDSVLKAVKNPHLIPVTEEGRVDLEKLEALLSSFEKPGLLSLMLVNNETGVIQPVQEVARLARSKGWKVHTDASQALGHVPLSFKNLGVDLLTLSSHKCGGPIGVGALVIKESLHLAPLIRGGGQEYGMRAGTLSAPLIVGFATAAKEALNDNSTLLQRYQQKIETSLPAAVVYGKKAPRVSHVVSLGMPGVLAELQLMAFDLKGIAISAGAACSSGTMKTSHVLTAMGIPEQEARCAIRVSMGWQTRKEDIDQFIQEWQNIYHLQRLKEAS
ncbi:MAG: cysteine desulfurase [Proteobacteria bacterium]|nr:cysteine desulfurase [Pseudomonadota bacterium]